MGRGRSWGCLGNSWKPVNIAGIQRSCGILRYGRDWTGVGSSGDRSVHTSRGCSSLVELWVGVNDVVSCGNFDFEEEMGEGSGVVRY